MRSPNVTTWGYDRKFVNLGSKFRELLKGDCFYNDILIIV
jgi:hypothetical protein